VIAHLQTSAAPQSSSKWQTQQQSFGDVQVMLLTAELTE
jgi:hypothetical protein